MRTRDEGEFVRHTLDGVHQLSRESPTFDIVTYGWERHAGLRHDAELLHRALTQLGYSAVVVKRPTYRTFAWRVIMSRKARVVWADWMMRRWLAGVAAVRRKIRSGRPRVAIHIQYPSPRHLVRGDRQVYVPNPEWFWDRDAWALPFIDVVFCKSRHAVSVFAAAGSTAEYIGFTSEDCHVPGVTPDRSRWLHVASNGHQKGTDEIVQAWHRHPEWPHLTVLAAKRTAPIQPAGNLEVVTDWLDDAQLRTVMQRSGVHLCPSNAEGFGHTIVEAMSCGVLVITTDLAPMNEFIDEGRGLLVDVAESTPMGWARRARFGQDALEDTVRRAIAMSDDEYARRSAAARAWYLAKDQAFLDRLDEFVTRLTLEQDTPRSAGLTTR